MKLYEIDDTKIENSNQYWRQKGRFEMLPFMFGEKGYIIQIEQKSIKGLEGKRTAEVSFFRSDVSNTEAAFSTTDDKTKPFGVYGIVVNALLDKFDDFDAFYFSAESRHSKSMEDFKTKIKIYSYFALRISKQTGARVFTIPEQFNQIHQHTEWIVSKIPITEGLFVDEQKIATEWIINNFSPVVVERIN